MASNKEPALSLRVVQTLRVFSVDISGARGAEAKGTSHMKKMVRSPSDEVLMTELAIDGKDMTIYDISSVVLFGERAETIPHGEFKCYMDHTNKEFFIDISNKTKLEAFTKSVMLNLIELAQDAAAETIYICVRKSVDKQIVQEFLKSFLFIGFIQLTADEQKKISMTQTHTLLKYKVNADPDDF